MQLRLRSAAGRVWRSLLVAQSVTGAMPWLAASRVLALPLGFATSVLIARSLGPYGKGITNTVVLVSTFVAAIANLGIGQGVFYYQSKNEVAPAASLTILTLVGGATTVACLALGLGPLRGILELGAGAVESPYLVAGLVLGGLALLGTFYSDLLRGLGLAHLAAVIALAAQAVTAAAVAAVLIAGGGLPWVVGTLLLSALSTIALSLLALRRLGALHGSFPSGDLLRFLRFGRALYLSGLVVLLHTRFNQMFVLVRLDPAALGQFGVAVTIAETLWLVDQPLIGAAQFHIASRSREASITLVNQMTRLIGAVQFCACALLALFGSLLVVFVFGEAFRPAVVPLLLSLPGVLFWSVGRSVSQYIGFQLVRNDINFYVQLVSAAVNVVATIACVGLWGIGGAALAASMSYGLAMVLLLAYYLRATDGRLADVVLVRRGDVHAVLLPQWRRLAALFRPATAC